MPDTHVYVRTAKRPRPSGQAPTFADLSALHPLILQYVKQIAPHVLLPVSRELYDELLPIVYGRIKLNKHNAPLLFEGFLPLSNHTFSSSSKKPNWKRGGRYSYIELPSQGRRARSTPPSPVLASRHLGPDRPSHNLYSTPDFTSNQKWSKQPADAPSTGSSLRHNRKARALAYTTHLTLLDAESLSIICSAHIELLSYSPISHPTSLTSHPYSHGHREEHKWPLRNVRTLIVGWPLIRYLADSHSPHPKAKALPICCIPIEATSLVIELGRLGTLRKGHLRQAIGELASEFQLERLEYIIGSSPETSRWPQIKDKDNEGIEARSPGPVDGDDVTDHGGEAGYGEVYIPSLSHPPPAPNIRLVLSGPLNQELRTRDHVGAHNQCTGEEQVWEAGIGKHVQALTIWMQESAARVARLPKIEIVVSEAKYIEERLVRIFNETTAFQASKETRSNDEGGEGEGGRTTGTEGADDAGQRTVANTESARKVLAACHFVEPRKSG